MSTLAEQLTAVETAISDILTNGQSLTEDGQTLNRADLRTLYAERSRLERKIERESSGRLRMYET